MLNFLQSIFTPSARQAAGVDEGLIQAATERVVDGTDPRLRALGNYRKRLRSAVACSVDYVIALVDGVPPSVEISRRSFETDSRLRAFFVSPDHLQEVVSYSQDLRNYLQKATAPLPDQIYCLLSLDRSERNVLGLDLQGETIRREVAQVVVNFSDHRLVGLAGDEAETRWELKKRAFDHLIQTALQRLLAVRTRKQELEQQRVLLQQKLKAMKSGDWGLEPVLKPATENRPDPAAVEQQIAGIEAELLALRTDSATLEAHLASVAATLSEPREHLRLEHISLTLDTMGVIRAEASAANVITLALDEVVGDGRRRIVLLGRVPRADILPPRDLIEEMSRYLPSR